MILPQIPSQFIRNQTGVTAVQLAVMLPVLLLVATAVLEFGYFYLKRMEASRQVALAAQQISTNLELGPYIPQKNKFQGTLCADALGSGHISVAYQAARDGWKCTGWDEDINPDRTRDPQWAAYIIAYDTHESLTGIFQKFGIIPNEYKVTKVLHFQNDGCVKERWREHAGCLGILRSEVCGGLGLQNVMNFRAICRNNRIECDWKDPLIWDYSAHHLGKYSAHKVSELANSCQPTNHFCIMTIGSSGCPITWVD